MWILVGMMGAGKSTVGRELARIASREFADTDAMLTYRLGRPIPQLFAIYGESAFRDHETAILRGLEPSPTVLATGGGIVIREANWAEMRRLGTTIFLDVEAEVLKARLAKSKKPRPLLQHEDWEDRLATLLDARRELYLKADQVVTVESESMIDAAMKVYQALGGEV
ncbi:MAG: shikimate kinase [Fimbriimonadaceae bacterium]|nr:shikimate kinase [Fimbriimonadaceae bacterium]